MTEEQDKITLGTVELPVSALTFDQLQLVAGAISAQADTSLDMKTRMGLARDVIIAALNITSEEFGKMPMTMPQIFAAIGVIGKIAGLDNVEKMAAALKNSA